MESASQFTTPVSPSMAMDAFPPYQGPPTPGHRNTHRARFLYKLVSERLSQGGTPGLLPSLSEWAGFFSCSHMEMYDALRFLRNQGIEYHLTGLDTPLEVWRSERI